MNGLAAALGLFTVLPAPVLRDLDAATARRALSAWPWLGLALGALAGATAGLLGWLGGGGLLAAVAGIGVLAAVTGALHLDGLADTADGLGSRRPPDEALAIMKRSDIGPFGVVALLAALGLQVGALAGPAGAASAPWLLAGGALVARVAALGATGRGTRSARQGGFGALFIGVTPTATVAATALAALGVVSVLGWLSGGGGRAAAFAVAAVVAWAGSWVWRRHLDRRLGGQTGDTLGSLVEVAQTLFFVVAVVAPVV